LPSESTAVTATLYGVPVVSPESLKLIVWFRLGLAVGEATRTEEEPGQGDVEVP